MNRMRIDHLQSVLEVNVGLGKYHSSFMSSKLCRKRGAQVDHTILIFVRRTSVTNGRIFTAFPMCRVCVQAKYRQPPQNWPCAEGGGVPLVHRALQTTLVQGSRALVMLVKSGCSTLRFAFAFIVIDSPQCLHSLSLLFNRTCVYWEGL